MTIEKYKIKNDILLKLYDRQIHNINEYIEDFSDDLNKNYLQYLGKEIIDQIEIHFFELGEYGAEVNIYFNINLSSDNLKSILTLLNNYVYDRINDFLMQTAEETDSENQINEILGISPSSENGNIPIPPPFLVHCEKKNQQSPSSENGNIPPPFLVHCEKKNQQKSNVHEINRHVKRSKKRSGGKKKRSGRLHKRSGHLHKRSGGKKKRSGRLHKRSGHLHKRSGRKKKRSGRKKKT